MERGYYEKALTKFEHARSELGIRMELGTMRTSEWSWSSRFDADCNEKIEELRAKVAEQKNPFAWFPRIEDTPWCLWQRSRYQGDFSNQPADWIEVNSLHLQNSDIHYRLSCDWLTAIDASLTIGTRLLLRVSSWRTLDTRQQPRLSLQILLYQLLSSLLFPHQQRLLHPVPTMLPFRLSRFIYAAMASLIFNIRRSQTQSQAKQHYGSRRMYSTPFARYNIVPCGWANSYLLHAWPSSP